MKSISPFAGQEKRLELLHRLNQLGDIAIDATRIDLYPSIPISALTSNATISAFLDAFDWVIDEIRAI
jgi:hypothetical protein